MIDKKSHIYEVTKDVKVVVQGVGDPACENQSNGESINVDLTTSKASSDLRLK